MSGNSASYQCRRAEHESRSNASRSTAQTSSPPRSGATSAQPERRPCFISAAKSSNERERRSKLRNDERRGTTALKRGQGGLQAGVSGEHAARGGVLIDLEEIPSSSLALSTDGLALRLESRPRVHLLTRRHTT